MTERNKLKDRARDELFSHINRCGVLQAAEKDQEQWMEETMEYLAERYPDLAETDLRELYTLGLRFCRPAIPHGRDGSDEGDETDQDEVENRGEPVSAGADESSGS